MEHWLIDWLALTERLNEWQAGTDLLTDRQIARYRPILTYWHGLTGTEWTDQLTLTDCLPLTDGLTLTLEWQALTDSLNSRQHSTKETSPNLSVNVLMVFSSAVGSVVLLPAPIFWDCLIYGIFNRDWYWLTISHSNRILK